MATPTEAAGFWRPLEWASLFGKVIAFRIEGTGSYGIALISCVRRAQYDETKVNRPDRWLRRVNGNPETFDAENDARSCAG